MKSRLLFLFTICFMAFRSFATVHTIQVSNFMFSDSTMTFALGDTVTWQWIGGSHTTTSDNIPTSAASWNSAMTSSSTTFTYIPTVAGIYHYHCTPHQDLGMTGTFTVTAPSGVEAVNAASVFHMYPAPASSTLHLQFSTDAATTVTISNLIGKEVMKSAITSKETTLNIAALPNGLYIVTAVQNGKSYIQKLVVAH